MPFSINFGASLSLLRPKLSHERSFSMVLIPDPQSYVKFDANQPLFELQTAWIANSLKSLNIKRGALYR